MLNRKPLEVHHVGAAGSASVSQHVRHVLRQLARPARATATGPKRSSVKELAAHIPMRGRYLPIREGAGEQLHLCVCRRQRTAQRMVVGWRVGGGIEDVNTHRGKTIGAATRDRMALLATFVHAAFSYWVTVFPRVCFHIARWQHRARRIPDPVLRQLALAALAEKRGNIEGAAAFAAFAPTSRRGKV